MGAVVSFPKAEEIPTYTTTSFKRPHTVTKATAYKFTNKL